MVFAPSSPSEHFSIASRSKRRGSASLATARASVLGPWALQKWSRSVMSALAAPTVRTIAVVASSWNRAIGIA